MVYAVQPARLHKQPVTPSELCGGSNHQPWLDAWSDLAVICAQCGNEAMGLPVYTYNNSHTRFAAPGLYSNTAHHQRAARRSCRACSNSQREGPHQDPIVVIIIIMACTHGNKTARWMVCVQRKRARKRKRESVCIVHVGACGSPLTRLTGNKQHTKKNNTRTTGSS